MKRVMSIIFGLPIVIAILVLGNVYVIDAFLTIVAGIAMHEYLNAVSKKCKPVKWLGYLSCGLIAFLHVIPATMLWFWIVFEMAIIILILFSQVIFTEMKTNFEDISYTFFGIIYVILFISFISLTRGLENGKFLIWYPIIAAWGTDTSAYLVGYKFGKHKFNKISPKKSIEGCIGGIIGAVIIGISYTAIINNVLDFNYSLLFIGVMTAILSIISQLGDFSASSIKRFVDVKDFGNLIPGHGGMLDRIDSLLFLAPFAYMFLTFSQIM